MTSSLAHRGPDDSGVFTDETHGLALGNRRLSILDLSPRGHQPMSDRQATVWITYNGEIYNYREIGKELSQKGYVFHSDSDTEVILKAYEEWGVEAVRKFRGMFAFALWDSREETLFLFRDRVGVKPLYYYWKEGLLLFSSELRSFHLHPEFRKELHADALALFLQFGYIPSPHSIFRYTWKIQPGHYVEIGKDGVLREKKYWDILDFSHQPLFQKSEEEMEEELEQLLIEACTYRMVADVPVGIFLSGGVDSALVTSILQSQGRGRLRTFTIGFENREYDEAPYARNIAQYLGCDHHELYCTKQDFSELVEQMPDIYDEPFGDSSGIPTYLVSRFAREHVKVALSADGGDELFAGYTKYDLISRSYEFLGRFPSFLSWPLIFSLDLLSPEVVADMYKKATFFLPKQRNVEERIWKLRDMLQQKNLENVFRVGNSSWTEGQLRGLLIHQFQALETGFGDFPKIAHRDPLSQMQAMDFKTYLPDDILTKVDRATMRAGLEGREPLLDHRVAEYMARVPSALKRKQGRNKYIVRKILRKYIPDELTERPKHGFSIPLADWLRESSTLLFPRFFTYDSLKKQNLFDVEYVKKYIDRYRSDTSINAQKLWFLLVFQMWYEKWIGR